jgi:lipopolysaccharide export system protein LptA
MAFADKAVYDPRKEQISLFGKNPRIYRGNDMISGDKIVLWKDSERLQAFKNCLIEVTDKKAVPPDKMLIYSNFIDFDYAKDIAIFSDHVRVKNKKIKLNCEKMTVYLQNHDKKQEAKTTSVIDSTSNSKKDIDKIICEGAVCVDDPSARINSNRMIITFKDSKDGNKKTSPGIAGGTKRKVDLIKCFGNVHIVNKPKDAKVVPTLITSKDAVLNIPQNTVDLIGKVEIEEPRFVLTCEKMKLFAKDASSQKFEVNDASNEQHDGSIPKHIGVGKNKELTKIICLENTSKRNRKI